MVRALVAAGTLVIFAMVGIAAVPTPVSSRVSGRAGPDQTAPIAVTATLEGQVHDARGTTLPGAVIEAIHDASGWRALVLARRDGTFTIDGVPIGRVTLVVRKGEYEFRKVVTATPGTTTLVVRDSLHGDDDEASRARWPTASPGALTVASQLHGSASRRAMPAVSGLARPHTSMDAYARLDPSGFRRVGEAPLSTFSVDVDTASYANARRFLMEGELPPADAVRIEEWVNYFPYAYPAPRAGEAFSVATALTACPWNPQHQLLRIGVRGRPVAEAAPPARNLVFLVDVSGSMHSRDRLPLVKQALRMLVDDLTARDRIALVVYAGQSGLVLPSTAGDQKARIRAALARLDAGGSTNGAEGIQLAYRTAREAFVQGGVNRVVLATDGDFNVGVTSLGELTRLVEAERQNGVFLSVLGVGRGNYKDATLEQVADRGNGNYAYLDSLQEARRVLVEQVGATLETIAKDVKLQVEFNPRHVAEYRLIGYENRGLQTGDFGDDRKDAGEIGAGHTVTALYEIVPPGREAATGTATTLRYQRTPPPVSGTDGELATVSVRHKQPDGERSVLQTHAVGAVVSPADLDTAFAAAVAEAGLVLRQDPLATAASVRAALARARAHLGPDPGGWRAEFVRLLSLADSLRVPDDPPLSPEP